LNAVFGLSDSLTVQTEIKYLGFVVSDGGIKTDPDKVSVVKNWPAIKNVKDLKSF
jgi:type III secretory pathway component EscU